MDIQYFMMIKDEYTEHLIDAVASCIYEGLHSIYQEAVDVAEKTQHIDRILYIFQTMVADIPSWSQERVMQETNRIKQMSATTEYFDDLVKAVIRSNIILLSFSDRVSDVIGTNFYNSFTTANFIHKCYIECGKDAFNHSYLFFHYKVPPMDIKRNQIILQQRIQQGIRRAIRKFLPVSLIIKEFLVNTLELKTAPDTHNAMPQNLLRANYPSREAEHNMAFGTAFAASKEAARDKTRFMTQELMPEMNMNREPNREANRVESKADVVIDHHPGKSDPNLKREVMEAIKSESQKTDRERFREIMSVDKIINAVHQNYCADKTQRESRESRKSRTESAHPKSSTSTSQKSNIILKFDDITTNAGLKSCSMAKSESNKSATQETLTAKSNVIEAYGSEFAPPPQPSKKKA